MTAVAVMLLAMISITVRIMMFQARLNRRRTLRETHRVDEPPPPQAREHASLATVKEHELVRLTGRVKQLAEPIHSPLTKQACIACLSRAQVWHSRKIPQLIEDLRDARLAAFVLEVDGGEVFVDGCGSAPIRIEMKTTKVSPTSEDAHALLATHKLERFAPSTDFEEALVQAGDRIAVAGVLVRERKEPAGYRDVAEERLKLVADPRHPVTLSDD